MKVTFKIKEPSGLKLKQITGVGGKIMMIQAEGEPSPALTAGGISQRFWWALLATLVVIFMVWGFFLQPPYNFILWGLGLGFLIIFLVLVYRSIRAPTKLEFVEVRRLIACDKCGVETEGPYEDGDHVFRDVGLCPRCDGKLYIKAIYSIDSKQPLKRQQPKSEQPHQKRSNSEG